MSRYGGYRRPDFTSPAGDRSEITPRLIRRQAGHNARVTIETDATNRRSPREQDSCDYVRVENTYPDVERIRLRRQERVEPPLVYYKRQRRHSSFPSKTTYSSPAPRPSGPPSEPPTEDEVVIGLPSAVEDDDGYDEDLDFKIPKVTASVKFADDVTFIIPDSGLDDSQGKPSPPSKPKFTGQVTELAIVDSHWNGNTFERGELGAHLKTMPTGLETSEKRPDPLMRWYHLHRPMMSFEEFIAASQGVLQLPEKEQRDVVKLLRDVQKKFEKQRHHGRELEPNSVSDVFYNDLTGTSKQTESVLFL